MLLEDTHIVVRARASSKGQVHLLAYLIAEGALIVLVYYYAC